MYVCSSLCIGAGIYKHTHVQSESYLLFIAFFFNYLVALHKYIYTFIHTYVHKQTPFSLQFEIIVILFVFLTVDNLFVCFRLLYPDTLPLFQLTHTHTYNQVGVVRHKSSSRDL